MRRLTKTERAAAMAVLAMAASVAGAGVALLKKHTRMMAEKAASVFKEDEETPENGQDAAENAAESREQAVEPEAEAKLSEEETAKPAEDKEQE